MNGQSPGKRIIGIRVVKTNGEIPSMSDYFLRWSFKILDVGSSLGAVATLFISSSETGQRVGDMVAKTTVIKTTPSAGFSLEEVLSIGKKNKHEPSYTGVTQYTDEDMLILKNAVDRYKRYPNEAHEKVVSTLSQKVIDQLNITPNESSEIDFLSKVLKDYIVLTR